MTNDQNVVRARHVESLAADLSDFVTQSNDNLHQAVQAELAEFDTGGNSAVILGSDSSIVDGTLWLEDVTNSTPIVKLYHGGNVYDFPTTPDFTVIDHSAATVGQQFTVKSDTTSVVGSAYNDLITITGSDNRIVETAGNNNFYAKSPGRNNTIIGGTGNDRFYCAYNANYIDLTAGGNNTVSINGYSDNNTVIGGSGDDSIVLHKYTSTSLGANHIALTAGNNTVEIKKNYNTVIGGSGNDSIVLYFACGTLIDLSMGNNTVYGSGETDTPRPSDNTIIGGTGNDRLRLHSCSTNYIDLTAGGNNTVSIDGSSGNDTVICGAGDDSIYCRSKNSLVSLVAGNNNVYAYINDTVIGGSDDDSIYCPFSGNHVFLVAGNNTVYPSSDNNTIYCGAGNDRINFFTKMKNTVYYFSDNDTLALPTVRSTSWDASLDSSTVLITVNGSADSVVTCQDYTATQFHISAGGTDGVYTIQGSGLVPAGS